MLSQTRGGAAGDGRCRQLVVLALVPGRPRRIFALGVIGLGIVAISAPLLDVYQNMPKDQAADPELVKFAARRIILAALAVGVAWGVAQLLLQRADRRAARPRPAGCAMVKDFLQPASS